MIREKSKIFCFLLTCAVFVLCSTCLATEPPADRGKNYYNQNSAFGLTTLPQTSHPDSLQKELQPIELFGLQFFNRSPETTSILSGGTVTPDYPLGPGDVLDIYLGDKAQQQFQVRVSADGKIYVPTVGLFDVDGVSLEDFHNRLDVRLQRLYNNYIVDIVLTTPKRVRVSIVGEVVTPGNYSVNALNTALDAIFMAGGPTDLGSLRNIELYRNDSLIHYIDLYSFILLQKDPPNIYLHNDDRLFVPVRKKVVSIDGEVYRQKKFELSTQNPEKLSDLIALAGGLTDQALLHKIEFSRVQPDGNRYVELLDYQSIMNEPAGAENKVLQNQDRVHVYSIRDTMHTPVISIFGQVRMPGEYEYESNMRINDLILKAGGLARNAYILNACLARVDPQQAYTPRELNLKGIMDGTHPDKEIILEPDDQVFIRQIPEWQVGPLVEIKGEVKFPGLYPIVRDSTTLGMVMQSAGGITGKANLSEATLTRKAVVTNNDKEFERLKEMDRSDMSLLEYQYFVMKQNTSDMQNILVDFELLLSGAQDKDVVLQDGDVVNIPEAPNMVWVTGRVAKTGGIMLEPGARLDYYIREAGGYSWDADPGKTKVILASGEIRNGRKVKQFAPGDRIWVPRKPDYNFWEIFRDVMLVAGQIATVYLVIERATN